MTYEKATEIMTNWLNNGHEGMTGERLGYIEGWFHEEDKEAFELAIEALHFMNNHSGIQGVLGQLDKAPAVELPQVVLFAENMTEEEKQKLVAEFKAVMNNANFTVGSERPQGEWQTQYETVCGFKYEVNNKACSNCGHTTKFKFPHCPWCGACMRGEKND